MNNKEKQIEKRALEMFFEHTPKADYFDFEEVRWMYECLAEQEFILAQKTM